MYAEIKVWLEDIEKAITEINDFLPDPKNFLEFQKDIKTKRAVERNIEIIGCIFRNVCHPVPILVCPPQMLVRHTINMRHSPA